MVITEHRTFVFFHLGNLLVFQHTVIFCFPFYRKLWKKTFLCIRNSDVSHRSQVNIEGSGRLKCGVKDLNIYFQYTGFKNVGS